VPAIAFFLGNLVTLYLIGLVSTLLVPFFYTPLPSVICIIIIVSASIFLVYMLCNKHIQSLLGKGWTPLAAVISGTSVLVTNHEQWQCQGRRDLGEERGKRAPLIDQDD